jgi:hypothetical protein
VDLTGQRFGHLTVQHLAKKKAGSGLRWLCRCDCGRRVVVGGADLRRGHTQSCSCLKSSRLVDLTGKRFGKLTVLHRSHRVGPSGRQYWVCRCDCGQTKTFHRRSLSDGATNCGCSWKPGSIDLVGQRFGGLVVLKRAGTVAGKRRWTCRCDCGRTTTVPTGNLRSGNSRSCGCGRGGEATAPAPAPPPATPNAPRGGRPRGRGGRPRSAATQEVYRYCYDEYTRGTKRSQIWEAARRRFGPHAPRHEHHVTLYARRYALAHGLPLTRGGN